MATATTTTTKLTTTTSTLDGAVQSGHAPISPHGAYHAANLQQAPQMVQDRTREHQSLQAALQLDQFLWQSIEHSQRQIGQIQSLWKQMNPGTEPVVS